MKNRYFQFLRGILIICVVLIHTMFYNNLKYANYFNITLRCAINFCVSIFIFISAYFVNKEKVENEPIKYIIKRSTKLIIPLLIWNIIYGIYGYIRNNNVIQILKNAVKFSTAPQLYYIIVLIQLVILTPIIIKLMKNKNIKKCIYLITPIYLLIILICKIIFKMNIPFYQYYFFGWIIYYLIGLDKNNIKKENIILTIVMLLLSIIGNNIIYYINSSNYSYACSQLNILNMMYVVCLIPVILNYDSKYKTTKVTKIFESIGDNSYGIYFIHIIFLNIISVIIKKLNMNFLIYYIITTCITLFVSYYFIKIFKKITNGKLDKYLGF